MSTVNYSVAVHPQPVPAQGPLPRALRPLSSARVIERNLQSLLTVKEDVEKVGAVLRRDGRKIRLTRLLASGGEGKVFATDQPGVVCKIYHGDQLTSGAERKIALMETRGVSHPAISWPRGSVVDSYGIFRGFLMPLAEGRPLGHGLFIPTAWLRAHPSWTRRDSVALALRILEGISQLHQVDVLLGDINPMNILVESNGNVHFVDCDSYQVEGFPCPVGATNFVAPEIQGQDFGKMLRTLEHELFAVATLLFMILLPGKPPYSHRGGTDGASNIQKMHFPYPLGEKNSDGAPDGAWRFCWSHLTRPLKEAFHQSFHADFRGRPRVPVAKWHQLLSDYARLLANPRAVFCGPTPSYGFDLSVLPHNFRYVEGRGREPSRNGESDLQISLRRMKAKSSGVFRAGHATPLHTGARPNSSNVAYRTARPVFRQAPPMQNGSGLFTTLVRWLFS